MAFGTFFKKIISGAKNILPKIKNVVKKGAEIVNKIAPAVSSAVNSFGTPWSSVISNAVDTVGSAAGKLNKYLGGDSKADKRLLGSNGSGIRRFDVPLLKNNLDY